MALTPVFRYFTQPYVLSCAPRAGLQSGGMLLTVKGAYYPDIASGEALLCRFEAYTAPGRYISHQKVEVTEPRPQLL